MSPAPNDGRSPPRRTKARPRSGPRKAFGAYAERLAAEYLEAHGYRLLARNVHLRVGEIDIVAEKDGMTILVEVRARREDDTTTAAIESLSTGKQRRMRRAAELYLATHPELPQEGRIDLVAVTLSRTGALRAIQLVENAVEGG